MDSIIKIKGLTKYYGKIKAVSDLDLSIPYGKVYGFLGPNGAGKTTVIKSLLGLTTPTAGEIQIFGKNLYLERNKIMKNVGAVVESPALFAEFSAFENLKFLTRFSGGVSDSKINEMLELVGLDHTGKQRVGTFSYGMKQRLGIAQALLPDNKLVFLDEPTNGLDPHGILGVRKLIRRLSEELGVTVFLSSHLLSEVEQVCDSVAIIDKGIKICESDIADLTTREVVEIKVANFAEFAKFAERKNLEILKTVEKNADFSVVHIEGREKDIPELLNQLSKEKIAVFAIFSYQNKLEDIFVELTGTDSDSSGSDRF